MALVAYLSVCNAIQLHWFFLARRSGLWQLDPVLKWAYVVATVGAILVELPSVSQTHWHAPSMADSMREINFNFTKILTHTHTRVHPLPGQAHPTPTHPHSLYCTI